MGRATDQDHLQAVGRKLQVAKACTDQWEQCARGLPQHDEAYIMR